jgi:hypothetical protein
MMPFDLFWKIFKYPLYLVLIILIPSTIVLGIGETFGAPGVILLLAVLGTAGWLYVRKRLPTRKAEF